jgi:hypothetical protein
LKENQTETLDKTQAWLSETHGVFLIDFALHDLIWNSNQAKKVVKEIDELHLACPKCKSEEKHYPLFLNMKIICFICGYEYPVLK